MPTPPEQFFVANFEQLTKHSPYPWQKELFLRFISHPDPWPELVNLPTGAGKTATLHVWLLALAWSIKTQTAGVPRRLAWIVNRRVVVDQITTEAENVRKRLGEDPNLNELVAILESASASKTALVISTLRGQFADNGDWRRDPSTPAVVIGTVDMIGSRLLFRGYQSGPYHRPLQAGLLGVDSLIVNDETHLTPAFKKLLRSLKDRNPAGNIPGKEFRILMLSATSERSDSLAYFDHNPESDVKASPRFAKIFSAAKSLTLHQVPDLNKWRSLVSQLVMESPAQRTALFIEKPESAREWQERLEKAGKSCSLLTGTMRGYERDRLLTDESFARFLHAEAPAEQTWIVCTSAGEVGINFTCERLITDLTEADHLLQRFGRLNRFGTADRAEAHVVFRSPSEKEPRLQRALEYLQTLNGDISCASVWGSRPGADACTELPRTAELEDRLIDMWSQTTQHDRVMPRVEPWLHGKQDSDPPQTEVAWRSDTELLASWAGPKVIENVLEYYPVLTREKLSEPSTRIAAKLLEFRSMIGDEQSRKIRLIVVDTDKTARVCDLAYVTEEGANFLANKLLLLPETVGSLQCGMFVPRKKLESDPALDVADSINDAGHAARTRIRQVGESWSRFPSKDLVGLTDEVDEDFFRPAFEIENPEDETDRLIYYGVLRERKGRTSVLLASHLAEVAAKAELFAASAGLSDLAATYCRAGKLHDVGKNRELWQIAMGNSMGGDPIAKSKKPANLNLLRGYRHELGSLVEALDAEGPHKCEGDLLLHLIASHHAAARPFFTERQVDPQNISASRRASLETVRRYARLQNRFGPWGLAYLEALFKCADGKVSAEEGEQASA